MTATSVVGTLLVKHHRSSTYFVKSNSYYYLPIKRYRRQAIIQTLVIRHCPLFSLTGRKNMSKALIRELDLKMQQVKEYGLIAHGYHNENFQYPIHVRRSHDGEKLPRTPPVVSNLDTRLTRTPHTILAPSSQENTTTTRKLTHGSTRSNPDRLIFDERQTTLNAPPNKTVRDIELLRSDDNHSYTTSPALSRLKSSSHYYHRKSPVSADSSPLLSSNRPHSIACISTTTTTTSDSNENSTKTLLRNETDDSLSNSSQSLTSQSRTITQRLSQRFFSKLFHYHSSSSSNNPPKS